MRGRASYFAAAVIAVAGVLLLAGPAGAGRQAHATAATNVHCGDTINASITMNGDLDCSGYSGTALTVTSNGVTLDLGGHTITGNNGYSVVVADGACPNAGNCDGVTVTDGTITGGNTQVDFWGEGDKASNLTLTGATSNGIYLNLTTDAVVTQNVISGAGIYDLYDRMGASSTISSNTLLDAGSTNVFLGATDAEIVSSNISRVVGPGSTNNIEFFQSEMGAAIGNVATSGASGIDIESDGRGMTDVLNNAVRSSRVAGFYIYGDYGIDIYTGGPFAVISGNQANYSRGDGFYENCSVGTFENNSASWNAGDGFDFTSPCADTIDNNLARYNGSAGFAVSVGSSDALPKSFAANTAVYNGNYGFVSLYPIAGSGNAGNGTNSPADCLQVAGCS